MGGMGPYTRTAVTVTLALLVGPLPMARAQTPSPVASAPAEVGVGLTINRLGTDVNAGPTCAVLSLPCTHDQPSRWGGFGLDLAGSVAVSPRLAFTAAATVSAHGWDSRRSIAARTAETDVVSAGLVGLTLRSRFSHPIARTGEQDRPFVQILAGVEHTAVVPTHPVVDVTVGIDSYGPVGARRRPATVRLAIAYRVSPWVSDEVSGLRFLFGVVIGPH
jgi:hypothetical protein